MTERICQNRFKVLLKKRRSTHLHISRSKLKASFFIPVLTCGFDATSGLNPISIQSPGWPSYYSNGEKCEWRFRASTRGYKLRIEFHVFETERLYDELNVS